MQTSNNKGLDTSAPAKRAKRSNGFPAKVSNADAFLEGLLKQLAGVLGADVEDLPAVFRSAEPRALRIGVYRDIRSPAARAMLLAPWLHRWTRSRQYLEAIDCGGPRYCLDCKPAGLITELERACARAGLQQHKRKRAPAPSAGGGVSSDPGRPILRLPSLMRRPAPWPAAYTARDRTTAAGRGTAASTIPSAGGIRSRRGRRHCRAVVEPLPVLRWPRVPVVQARPATMGAGLTPSFTQPHGHNSERN